jgi:hypothetical protein
MLITGFLLMISLGVGNFLPESVWAVCTHHKLLFADEKMID